MISLRGLRGARLDPFGAATVRRTERALIANYRAVICDPLEKLRFDDNTDYHELLASEYGADVLEWPCQRPIHSPRRRPVFSR
ncbi:DUF6537 domain-containing protein [Nocardia gipuzkoensis]